MIHDLMRTNLPANVAVRFLVGNDHNFEREAPAGFCAAVGVQLYDAFDDAKATLGDGAVGTEAAAIEDVLGARNNELLQ
jgi:hypothetical protein